ncbi:MAG: hypothetical protein WCT12_15590 [Verrucomicrobiota bacterium]
MKTATVRDLRNHFPRVAAWIAEGEPVAITKAGKLFARLVPPAPVKTPNLAKPDIMDERTRVGVVGSRMHHPKSASSETTDDRMTRMGTGFLMVENLFRGQPPGEHPLHRNPFCYPENP